MRISDWSSDVCSSDLVAKLRKEVAAALRTHVEQAPYRIDQIAGAVILAGFLLHVEQFAAPEVADRAVGILAEDVIHRFRSEGRRVGKECVSTCRSRGSPCH